MYLHLPDQVMGLGEFLFDFQSENGEFWCILGGFYGGFLCDYHLDKCYKRV